jgi:chemotaxis protein methyltransferase CheR
MIMFEQEKPDPQFLWFVEEVKKKLNLDLSGYKPHRVKRRTDMLLRKYNVASYQEYMKLINTDDKKKEEFLDKMTINVTEFFRNPEKWESLKKTHLPFLMKSGTGRLKIWSAGCSSGEEPYSMAITLEEIKAPAGSTIIATDIDTGVLAKAKIGVYDERSFVSTPDTILRKYFKKIDEETYEVLQNVKNRVQFKKHNMLQDTFEKNLDLIVCRNVVIYFEAETKNTLYKNFVDSLRPGGLLFVGSTERIFNYRSLNLKTVEPFFYQKEGQA